MVDKQQCNYITYAILTAMWIFVAYNLYGIVSTEHNELVKVPCFFEDLSYLSSMPNTDVTSHCPSSVTNYKLNAHVWFTWQDKTWHNQVLCGTRTRTVCETQEQNKHDITIVGDCGSIYFTNASEFAPWVETSSTFMLVPNSTTTCHVWFMGDLPIVYFQDVFPTDTQSRHRVLYLVATCGFVLCLACGTTYSFLDAAASYQPKKKQNALFAQELHKQSGYGSA